MNEESEPSVFESTDITRPTAPWWVTAAWLFLAVFLLVDVVFVGFFVVSRAPAEFPVSEPIVIETGTSASAAADKLREANVVRSAGVLYVILLLFHDPGDIKAGSYIFTEKESAFTVANIITADVPQQELLRLTFPEGFSVEDYAAIASNKLSDFDAEQFVNLASSSEGYLFPDTYYVPPTYTAGELAVLLKDTFRTKIDGVSSAIASSSLSQYEVITLASIIEREANSPESMSIVAGILLQRLELGMPLQTDASIEYVLDKPLSELTPKDLKIDSPYNTYRNQGLPPTPIGNPGLVAISAVLEPIQTEYLYYLTAPDGQFYYARTYEEHQQNIERYLR